LPGAETKFLTFMMQNSFFYKLYIFSYRLD